jgi:DNA uptake protein ComE-like DNA-binding protein
MNATRQAEELLKECLRELESSKGSVLAGIQKLNRAAEMLGEEDIHIWCEIQLGNAKYIVPLEIAAKHQSIYHLEILEELEKRNYNKEAVNEVFKEYNVEVKTTNVKSSTKEAKEAEKTLEQSKKDVARLINLGLKKEIHYTIEERNIKSRESTGGYKNIGEIEEIYTNLVRLKSGNNGIHYQRNLNENINYVRRVANKHASKLYSKVAFANTPQTSLDILRAEVDSRLLDLAPEAAEKLMIAFKSVASNNPEEWSHALTSCRRFLEDLADALYPPRDEDIKGRKVGKTHYKNRLWAFMDDAIESESNRELAKSHIDYLGSYMEKVHNLSNKGVHSNLTKIEAVKAVFHTYLTVADILDYLKKDVTLKDKKLNVHSSTLDELESVLEISRNLAKEIVKLRVEFGVLDLARLATIKGIGKKTLTLAEKVLSFESVA